MVNQNLKIFLVCSVGVFLVLLFYIYPADSIGLLFTKEQLDTSIDQSFYLYHAREFCSNVPEEISDYQVTWSSFGVVSWLTLSCLITGSIYSFLIFNSIIFSFGLSYLINTLKEEYSLKINIFSILLVPYSLLHLMMPGKEIFSTVSCMLFFACTLRILNDKITVKVLSILCVAFVVATYSRLHEGAILVICFILTISSIKLGFYKVFLLFVFIASIINKILFEQIADLFGITSITNIYEQIVFKSEFDFYLSNENLIIHLLLSPIRIFILVIGFAVGPINNFIITEYKGFNYFLFKEAALLLRVIDGSVLIYFFWCFRSNYNIYVFRIIYIFIFYYFLFITVAGVDQKTRYFTGILPIVAVMFLCKKISRK